MNIKTSIKWICVLVAIATISTIYSLIEVQEYGVAIFFGLIGICTLMIYKWIYNNIS
jgi:hypothetical protein